MAEYHRYQVNYQHPVSGQMNQTTADLTDAQHKAHGDNGNGKLKDAASWVTIVSGLTGLGKDAIKGFKYLAKIIK
jgi:hypothetical protein